MMDLRKTDVIREYYNESRTRASTRTSIVQGVYDLISENNVYDLNLKMVCEKVGIERQHFYRYYATLDSSIYDAVAAALDIFAHEIVAKIEELKDYEPEEQLKLFFGSLKGARAIKLSKVVAQFDIISDNAPGEYMERFHQLHDPTRMYFRKCEDIIISGIEKGIFRVPKRGIGFELDYIFYSFISLASRMKNQDLERIKNRKNDMMDAFIEDAIGKFMK